MTTAKTIEEISLLGGHPVLDFVNTVDSRGERWGPDFLQGYEDLVAWARRLDLIDENERGNLLTEAEARPSDAMNELRSAKQFRECLYRVLSTEADRSAPAPEDIAVVNDAVARARSNRELAWVAGGLQWKETPSDPLSIVMLRVAWLAAELLVPGSTRRPIRTCSGRNCGWLFLDQSRGGHRRWCSDKTCGSHARVRKFRAVRTG
jgi:predicted RNA-binding Zn ribbon-like protein